MKCFSPRHVMCERHSMFDCSERWMWVNRDLCLHWWIYKGRDCWRVYKRYQDIHLVITMIERSCTHRLSADIHQLYHVLKLLTFDQLKLFCYFTFLFIHYVYWDLCFLFRKILVRVWSDEKWLARDKKNILQISVLSIVTMNIHCRFLPLKVNVYQIYISVLQSNCSTSADCAASLDHSECLHNTCLCSTGFIENAGRCLSKYSSSAQNFLYSVTKHLIR